MKNLVRLLLITELKISYKKHVTSVLWKVTALVFRFHIKKLSQHDIFYQITNKELIQKLQLKNIHTNKI